MKSKKHISYSPKLKKFSLKHTISAHQRPIFLNNYLNHSLAKVATSNESDCSTNGASAKAHEQSDKSDCSVCK